MMKLWFTAIGLFVIFVSNAGAALPLAGTAIDNQAFASFVDQTTGDRTDLSSNVVRVTVAPLEAVLLTEPRVLFGTRDNQIVFSHRLTNTGNTSTTYKLSFANEIGDDFNLTGLTLHQDTLFNGQLDSGEPVIANDGTVFLYPGQSIDLILVGTTPSSVAAGQVARLDLRATSTTDVAATASNIDEVRVTDAAVLTLGKTASVSSARPGDVISYTLGGKNVGGSPATGIAVTLDGSAVSRVVIRDPIPANTQLSEAPTSTGPQVLYHLAAEIDIHRYQTALPSNLADVDAVAFALPVVNPFTMINQGYTGVFKVRVNPAASGDVVNRASAYYLGGVTAIIASNETRTPVGMLPPRIQYFSDPLFTRTANVSRLGALLYVQADAALCNLLPTTPETRVIVLTSALTGDRETFNAIESGPNTGKFQILPNVQTRESRISITGDGIIQSLKNDTITAQIDGCGAGLGLTIILIDPLGIVFDAVTKLPVAGATVSLLHADGSPVDVFDFDGVTPLQNFKKTDTDGTYQFPTVAACSGGPCYRLKIDPPPGYKLHAPSGELFSGFTMDALGSYGGLFDISIASGPVRLDIPLDPKPQDGLLVKKEAKRNLVEFGDFVDYVVTVSNGTGGDLTNVGVTDRLPAGFYYVKGTTRRDGDVIVDPSGDHGVLSFNIGSLTVGKDSKLSYRVRTGAGAMEGDGINRAQAIAGNVRSNVSSVKVTVQPGVFSDKAFVIGKVYLDCNRNRTQDVEEWGIPGVRLYMEDGTYVITDSEGKYSIYGVSPRTHVLKLDQTTMPYGSELIDLSNRNAGDPGSRFVDVKSGELHKANFAEGSCSDDVVAQVKARRAKAEREDQEAQQALKTQLTPDGQPVNVGDRRALASTGVVGATNQNTGIGYQSVLQQSTASADGLSTHAKLPDASASARPAAIDFEKLAQGLDSGLGFVGLKDQDTLPFAQTSVMVKGALGASFSLRVNDEEVSDKRVGRKTTFAEKQTEVWEYIGVNLKPGKNTLIVSQLDGFGNLRGTATVAVIAPDKLGKVHLIVPIAGSAADGRTPANVVVRLTDDQGVLVTVRTAVTLETDLGRFDVEDLNATESGVQVFIEGGEREFALLPPREPGQATIRATSGIIAAQSKLDFMPDLRPLIATGILEGVINLRNLNTHALVPSREQDGFEQELKHFSYEDGGKRSIAGRAAFFLKGKVKGDYLLTAAYDSDKDTKERLFRDIQPDEFYPVYGDSAIKGFDAQSTSRFYVRVDKQKSYLLFGDFTTQATSELRKLGNYTRSLTGVKHHFENDRVTVNSFASRDNTRQLVEEIAANGTSGPYELRRSGILENGERVEIITRDRNQTSVVLKSVAQSRFADYEIDVTSGRILFRAPVPSLDENLNPIFVRVSFEIDEGGERYWVAGVDAQVKVTDKIEVGGVYVIDRNPQAPSTLENNPKQIIGVNGAVRITDKTVVVGEIVQTESFDGKKGLGERLELKHKDDRVDASVYWGKTDSEFNNPGASLGKGRVEAGAKLGYKLDDKTRLIAEAIHTEDNATGGTRDGQLVAVERRFENNIRAEVGVRHSDESAIAAQESSVGTTPNEFTSIRGKLTAQVPGVEKANVFGEYEQAIDDSDRKLFAIGGDYQIASRAKLYARHELISTLSGPFSLNNDQTHNATVIGIDSDYTKNGHLFNEYRVRDSVSGREAEAAIGLRNLWPVAPGLALNTNFERVHSLGNGNGEESTAGAFGVEYTANPLWKGTGRIELRRGTSADSLLHTVGLGFKLDKNWTLLSKNIISLTKNKGTAVGEKWLERFQFGIAYRDTDADKWNGLARIEHKSEKDTTQIDQESRRNVEILSTHINYEPRNDWLLSGRFAAKWLNDQSFGNRNKSTAQLLGLRGTYEINHHWDVSAFGSTLFGRGDVGRQYGLGVEVGYMITANLWLSAGYNFFGFRDDDLGGGDYTNRGTFLRMRFKFDEDLFAARNAKVNNTLAQE